MDKNSTVQYPSPDEREQLHAEVVSDKDELIAQKDREVIGCQFGCDPDKIGQARRDHMKNRVTEVTYAQMGQTIATQRRALEALYDIASCLWSDFGDPNSKQGNSDESVREIMAIWSNTEDVDDFISAINKEHDDE